MLQNMLINETITVTIIKNYKFLYKNRHKIATKL